MIIIASGDIEDINILNQFSQYVNHEINSQARILCNQENVDIFELINYLPYTSPIIDTINQLPMTRAASFNFNKSTAVSYAKKYAVNPNPSYTTYSTDCTNFASQILRSGVHQQILHGNHIQPLGQLRIILKHTGILEVIVNMHQETLIHSQVICRRVDFIIADLGEGWTI